MCGLGIGVGDSPPLDAFVALVLPDPDILTDLIFGLGLLALAVFYPLLTRGAAPPTQIAQARRELSIWGIDDGDAWATGALTALMAATATLVRPTMVGIGGAMMGLACGNILYALLTSGSLLVDLTPGAGSALPALNMVNAAALFLALALGLSGGHLYGMGRLRRATVHGLAYGDARRRALTDYRTPHVLLVPLAAIVVTVAMTRALLPHLHPHLVVRILAAASPLAEPMRPWIWALPLAMGGTLLISEWLMRRLMISPRVLLVEDPTMARRLDDVLRARSITILQTAQFVIIGELGLAQEGLLLGNARYPVPDIVTLGDLVMTLVFLAGIFACWTRGRMGGHITGWPWDPDPTARGRERSG